MTFAHSTDRGIATCGALDLGSNMFRLVVGHRDSAGSLIVLGKSAEVVALAEGLLQNGEIGQAAIARATTTLQRFRHEIEERAIERVSAVGTGAFRSASNRDTVVAVLSEVLGAKIAVIDGKIEAELAVLGVRSGVAIELTDFCVIDVGGVSTEVVYSVGGRDESKSLEIGVITLTEEASSEFSHALARDEYMFRIARSALSPISALLGRSRAKTCFAVGGAAVALVAHRDGRSYCSFSGDGRSCLRKTELDALYRDYRQAPEGERASRIGVSRAHGNLIPAGYAILRAAMEHLAVDAVVPSGRGVAEGLLCKMIAECESP